jgi:hypothetical protein
VDTWGIEPSYTLDKKQLLELAYELYGDQKKAKKIFNSELKTIMYIEQETGWKAFKKQ